MSRALPSLRRVSKRRQRLEQADEMNAEDGI